MSEKKELQSGKGIVWNVPDPRTLRIKELEQRLSQAEAEKDDAERRWSEIADSLQKKISVYEAQEKAWLSRIVVGDMDACGALIDALKIQGTKLKEAEAEIRRIKNG